MNPHAAAAAALQDTASEVVARATPRAVATSLPPLERCWTIRHPCADGRAEELGKAVGLPAALCHMLLHRGHAELEQARRFLKPRLEHLHDPFALADMRHAVERIERALIQRETILVHGDYDVDGICAATLLTRVLTEMGGTVRTFVPNRLTDGYDLSHAGVRAAAEGGAALIVTADCGTVAHDAVAAAAASGIDVIVTDHHTPGPTLPPAVAVVNPNRRDCTYPDKGLAGVGVAYKVCQALARVRGADPKSLWYYLDLVALATIADLAPLTGENRVFARFGLQLLRQTRNPGLRALLRSAKVDVAEPLTGGQVSHVLAPRINAVGRMGDAQRGVRLLLASEDAAAEPLAAEMEVENDRRREVDRETLAQALTLLERDYDPARDFGIVLAAQDWHPGVIGIVASRVVEQIHRPTILIAIEPDGARARGSARSVPGFHLYEAIRDCGELLERYGGHRQAAGLEIRPERIDALRKAFNARAQAALLPEQLKPRLRIDLEVHLGEITTSMFTLMRHLGPFGMGNPTPVFAARGVTLARPPRTVGAGHARLVLRQDRAHLQAIGFGMADRVAALDPLSHPLDVVFHLQENRYSERLQARLIDIRIAQ
jgi:single-stranded-DNA-specific exonuclease